MKNEDLRAALWFVALLALVAWTTFGWLRYPAGDRVALHGTPFDRTPGLDRAYWDFLLHVREVLPEGDAFTIRAASPDQEMALFMIAVLVLDEHEPVPTTYYGVPNPGAGDVRWIASYQCAVIPPDATVVSELPDGCLCERTR